MITAHKHLDLNSSLIKTSSLILENLIEYKQSTFNELLYFIESEIGDLAQYMFCPSLDFLFLMGKIKYIQEYDLLELVI